MFIFWAMRRLYMYIHSEILWPLKTLIFRLLHIPYSRTGRKKPHQIYKQLLLSDYSCLWVVTYIFHCNFIRMHCTRWKKRHCGQKLKRSECWYCNAISLLFCLSSHVSTIYNLWRKYMIIVGHSWRQIQSRNYLIQLCICDM